jgi:catechol 2,3-dioxygenase-like lactoylglutathione lyase family enzyme
MVRDIKAGAKFYRDVAGLWEAFCMARPGGRGTGTIYFYIVSGQCIEIFPDGEGGQPTNENIGIRHICIQVDDAAVFQEEFRFRGGPIDAPLKTGYSKCIQF